MNAMIPAPASLAEALAQVDLAGHVVLGDALQTQRDVCEQIVAAGGDYLLPVKENQPALLADLEAAFPPLAPEARPMGSKPQVPEWLAADWERRGVKLTTAYQGSTKKQHGRIERREMWVLWVAELAGYAGSAGTVGKPWPHLAQIYWVRRRSGASNIAAALRTFSGRPRAAVALVLSGLTG